MPIQLVGIPVGDPKARIARQFLFSQGGETGVAGGRDIVIVGNAVGGTEPVETVPSTPFLNLSDCYSRVGRRGELSWMFRIIQQIAPQATVWPCVVAEAGGAAAATVNFTFATAADAASTIVINIMGRTLQVGVSSGDTAIQQATAVVAALSSDPDVPVTASNGGTAVVAVTAVNKGPRSTAILNAMRMSYFTPIASTVSKGSVTAGTTSDNFTNAIAALAAKNIYYHAPACTMPIGGGAPTVGDNGIGDYIAAINSWSLPGVGYDNQVCFGLDATQAQGATVATASAANAVLAKFFRVHGNDIPSSMVAAAGAASLWLEENTYAGASLTGYTTNSIKGTVLPIPDPYVKTNRPLASEITADLNNGVTPVCFTPNGQAFFNRVINSYSVLPGTSAKDYDAREGHIPSVVHYAWEYAYNRWLKQRQPNVMNDLPKGKRPPPGFNTPGGLASFLINVIDTLSSTACPSNNTPILDPSPEAVARMKASVYTQLTNNGLGASVAWEPVRHDNQDDFLIVQAGANT